MLFKIIQILFFQGVFILLYDLWLQKETFYTANRLYLIITSALSIFLPFLPVEIQRNTQIVALSEISLKTNAEMFLNNITMNSSFLILATYLMGVTLALGVFLRKLYKLFLLIHSNKKYKKKNFTIVSLKNEQKVFSFLNYIFIGENDLKKKIDYLLLHEQIHVQQKHSWDLLWFELLKIIFWFNPFIYLYQKRISTLHEFIADTKSVKASDKKTYYNHLLNDIFQVENMTFVNQFYNNSLIKKRIIMMTKQQSQQWKKAKYLLLIPIITLMLASCFDSKDNTIVTDDVTESVPFSIVDNIPVYPGCEGIDNEEEQKKCLSKSIQMHIAKEFNVDLAQTLDLKPGKKRIFTMFMIDKDGNIVNVKARAPHKDLEVEAIRVIKTLPKMQPGKNNGKTVGVKYSLPITFLVQDNEKENNNTK